MRLWEVILLLSPFVAVVAFILFLILDMFLRQQRDFRRLDERRKLDD